ncbi:MAG: hypothetical protein V5A56_01050 [Halolamina sp.]
MKNPTVPPEVVADEGERAMGQLPQPRTDLPDAETLSVTRHIEMGDRYRPDAARMAAA